MRTFAGNNHLPNTSSVISIQTSHTRIQVYAHDKIIYDTVTSMKKPSKAANHTSGGYFLLSPKALLIESYSCTTG